MSFYAYLVFCLFFAISQLYCNWWYKRRNWFLWWKLLTSQMVQLCNPGSHCFHFLFQGVYRGLSEGLHCADQTSSYQVWDMIKFILNCCLLHKKDACILVFLLCRNFLVSTVSSKILHVNTQSAIFQTLLHNNHEPFHALACHPSEPVVAMGNQQGVLNTWNYNKKVITGTKVFMMEMQIQCVTFDPKGKEGVSLNESKGVQLLMWTFCVSVQACTWQWALEVELFTYWTTPLCKESQRNVSTALLTASISSPSHQTQSTLPLRWVSRKSQQVAVFFFWMEFVTLSQSFDYCKNTVLSLKFSLIVF